MEGLEIEWQIVTVETMVLLEYAYILKIMLKILFFGTTHQIIIIIANAKRMYFS